MEKHQHQTGKHQKQHIQTNYGGKTAQNTKTSPKTTNKHPQTRPPHNSIKPLFKQASKPQPN
jgi:hypothetical protein